jgi:hypothetical protein
MSVSPRFPTPTAGRRVALLPLRSFNRTVVDLADEIALADLAHPHRSLVELCDELPDTLVWLNSPSTERHTAVA